MLTTGCSVVAGHHIVGGGCYRGDEGAREVVPGALGHVLQLSQHHARAGRVCRVPYVPGDGEGLAVAGTRHMPSLPPTTLLPSRSP